MTAPVSRPVSQPRRLGLLWWLPRDGFGNGLESAAWAPIIEVSGESVRAVMRALANAGVPAYAAAARQPGRLSARALPAPRYRLWVGSGAYARAENVLMTVGHRLGDREGGPDGPAAR